MKTIEEIRKEIEYQKLRYIIETNKIIKRDIECYIKALEYVLEV